MNRPWKVSSIMHKHTRLHIHSHLGAIFSIPNPSTVMFTDSGGSQENLEETHMDTGRKCETLHRPELKIDSRTLEL